MPKHAGPRWMTNDAPPDESMRPDGVIGPFLTVTLDEIDVFNDTFSEELDSDFASSICCCDVCYNHFRADWPDVAFREMAFQAQSMEAFYAVDHSRLPGIWSPAEISTLRHFVRCGRCREFAIGNIWIYEHSFGDAKEFEVKMDELSTIGDQTPFLLLEHEFARRVLAHIRASVIARGRFPAGQSLYGIDLALTAANFNLGLRRPLDKDSDNEFDITLGFDEHNFLFDYVKFLVSQNLANIDFADCLIEWVNREMHPHFVAPLSARGRRLVQLIASYEDEFVKSGLLEKDQYLRVCQEGFFEMKTDSYVARLPRIHFFQKIVLASKK